MFSTIHNKKHIDFIPVFDKIYIVAGDASDGLRNPCQETTNQMWLECADIYK